MSDDTDPNQGVHLDVPAPSSKRRLRAAGKAVAVAFRRHLFSRPSALYGFLRRIVRHNGEGTMKAALMLVATITATAPAWGAWTALGEDDAKAIWYVDPESIRSEGRVRHVWAMKDMAQPVTDVDLSMQLLYEVDCAGRRHRLVQYQAYKGRMGGGDPTRGGMVFGDWMPAGPGTVGGGIARAVCNRS